MNIFSKVLCFLLLLVVINSCKISKGFEALEVYNYFEAKRLFEKKLKKKLETAAYGLSVIYYRNDNPFHNIDSAYRYVLIALDNYDSLPLKKKEKLEEKLSFKRSTITEHREKISQHYFYIAKQKNTIKSYVHFTHTHPWSPLVDSAKYFEEGLAFENAVTMGSSQGYSYFLESYANNRFTEEAQHRLDLANYSETTVHGDLSSYVLFTNKYPNSPYYKAAEDSIYALSIVDNHIEEYAAFVKNFPQNKNTPEAWMKLYRLSITSYTKENIEGFLSNFPEFPFQDIVLSDLGMVDKVLLPFKSNNLMGYMDEHGNIVIEAQYKYVGHFKNGLAAVVKNENFGYIDKNNNLVIDYAYLEAQDFEQGRAIVEMEDGFGLIDRTGNYILPPYYDDIGALTEGIFYANKGEAFHYYNLDGKRLYNTNFDEAYSFSNGLAKVVKGKEIGFILPNGEYYIRVEIGDLRRYSDSIFIHTIRDSANLLHVNGSYLLPNFVDRISDLSENRAIVEHNHEYGYLNRKGEIVIPIQLDPYPNYFQFAQFYKGHAPLLRRGKYALMDSLGDHTLPAKYERIGGFGPLIPIARNDKWGYINSSGKLKIEYNYDYAYDFMNNELAIVEFDDIMGVINLEGDLVIPAHFENISVLNDSIFVVRKGGTFGFIDANGKLLTPVNYLRYDHVSSDLIQLEAHDRLDYFDLSKQLLITLREDNE